VQMMQTIASSLRDYNSDLYSITVANIFIYVAVSITTTSFYQALYSVLPSLFWRCWFSGRKSILSDMVLVWKESANNLHTVQLMPLPPRHLFSARIQNGSAFLVLANSCCSGKEAVKWVLHCWCLFKVHWTAEISLKTKFEGPNISAWKTKRIIWITKKTS